MKTPEYIAYILCIIISAFGIYYAIENIQGWFFKFVMCFLCFDLFVESFDKIEKL